MNYIKNVRQRVSELRKICCRHTRSSVDDFAKGLEKCNQAIDSLRNLETQMQFLEERNAVYVLELKVSHHNENPIISKQKAFWSEKDREEFAYNTSAILEWFSDVPGFNFNMIDEWIRYKLPIEKGTDTFQKLLQVK